MIVLDASAVLAYLFREPGHETVAALIESACISAVNHAEVLGRFSRDGFNAAEVSRRLEATYEIVAFDTEQAIRSAALLPVGAPLGLSLGDRACIALGASRKWPVYTADRAWAKLKVGVEVRLVR